MRTGATVALLLRTIWQFTHHKSHIDESMNHKHGRLGAGVSGGRIGIAEFIQNKNLRPPPAKVGPSGYHQP